MEDIMLENKVAIVTGASRGIGRAIALSLASYGASVVVNYCGSKEKAEEVVQEIRTAGGVASTYQADVADAEAVKLMFSDVMKLYGKIDILVNNAGITRDNLILKMTEDEFDSVINTNLKGVFNCLKQVSRIMLKQKSGRIINISSISGVIGNAGQVNYSASKAGVIGMTMSLAKELGSRGITVNAIAPGYIATDMTAVLNDEVKEKVAEQIPLKRLGEVEDIAELAAFLASSKASYITGQTIQVDGGLGI
jgi:3-oxoacyl-[acyl-carrier protein] reductase